MDDLFEDEEIIESSLSETQEKVLALLPIFTGLLSAWGSFQIIHRVTFATCRQRRRRLKRKYSDDVPQGMEEKTDDNDDDASVFWASTTCYQRIMLGLSISDVISSLALACQAFLLPAHSSQRVWAVGTDRTCSTMGFFQQLSLSSTLYNGMLSFVFLLTIRYAVSETKLSKTYEPWMHGLSGGFPLVTATLLALMGDVYGELQVGPWCWLTGSEYTVLGYFTTGIPIILCLVAVPVNNALVYGHVRKSVLQNPTLTRESEDGMRTVESDLQRSPCSSENGYEPSHSTQTAFSNEQTLQDDRREMVRLRDLQQRQFQRLKSVAFQGLLYVGAFLTTSLPTVTLRVVSSSLHLTPADEAAFFPLLLLQAIFLPLQGLFNFLIYTRTTYLQEIG